MAKPLRMERPGSRHHLNSRGNEARAIFRDECDRRHFVELPGSKVERFRLWLHAIVRRTAKSGRLIVALAGCLLAAGCVPFLAEHAVKSYTIDVPTAERARATNDYQADFVYLKNLGEQVFPLEDRYFPREKRHAMEEDLLRKLGEPGCTRETFVISIHRYLNAFNNMHTRVAYNPKPVVFRSSYPFQIHYFSNAVYVSDVTREYDHDLIGQRITAIDGEPIATVEQSLFAFVGAENLWTRRTALEPAGYSRPERYWFLGISPSPTNRLEVEFAAHPPVFFQPKSTNFHWLHSARHKHPVTAESMHLYDCRIFPKDNYAYFQFNSCFDKASILDGLDMVQPWMRPLVRAWLAFEFHRPHPSGFIRQFYDPIRPYLKDYLAASIRDVQRAGITNLIIDLRHNGGGDIDLCHQFLYFFTRSHDLQGYKSFAYNPAVDAYYDPCDGKEFSIWYKKKFGVPPPSGQLLPTPDNDKPFFVEVTNRDSIFYVAPNRPVFTGRIIVLVNQHTMSAASLLAGLMQDNGIAVTIGTSTENNPTGPTSMNVFRLPRSGMVVAMPTDYFERANPAKGEVFVPDYWVENSLTDLQQGRDAPFERALELIQPH